MCYSHDLFSLDHVVPKFDRIGPIPSYDTLCFEVNLTWILLCHSKFGPFLKLYAYFLHNISGYLVTRKLPPLLNDETGRKFCFSSNNFFPLPSMRMPCLPKCKKISCDFKRLFLLHWARLSAFYLLAV